MSGKRGIVIGLLIGIVLGLVGVLVTIHFTTSELKQRQADAYDKGYKAGVERAGKDGIDISGKLNQASYKQAQAATDLRNQLDSVKTQLQALQGRDDMTPQAKDQVQIILEGLH
jgi:hypothetical protein